MTEDEKKDMANTALLLDQEVTRRVIQAVVEMLQYPNIPRFPENFGMLSNGTIDKLGLSMALSDALELAICNFVKVEVSNELCRQEAVKNAIHKNTPPV